MARRARSRSAGAADTYRAWEEGWEPELAKRGVTPDMLGYVGEPDRPLAIDVSPPGKGWRAGKLDWDAEGDRAVLEAFSAACAEP
jgi:hypothetical protein